MPVRLPLSFVERKTPTTLPKLLRGYEDDDDEGREMGVRGREGQEERLSVSHGPLYYCLTVNRPRFLFSTSTERPLPAILRPRVTAFRQDTANGNSGGGETDAIGAVALHLRLRHRTRVVLSICSRKCVPFSYVFCFLNVHSYCSCILLFAVDASGVQAALSFIFRFPQR